MNLYTKIGVDVSKTDNGYVLEWKDETKEMHSMSSMAPKTHGIEVFSDKAKLMKRIESLI